MKKKLIFLALFTLIGTVSNANCNECDKKIQQNNSGEFQTQYQKENGKSDCQSKKDFEKSDEEKRTCDKCEIENDDEYYTYNQCFFDKQYRKMKIKLCLTRRQENCIDKIYRNFKTDMESYYTKYKNEKNKLLEMIECDNDCQKEQRKTLKEIKKETKEKCKELKEDIKDQLCKNQRSDFKKFQKEEKKKMKKIIKYGAIYKFPCVNCCKK
jgi:hypothetical protein